VLIESWITIAVVVLLIALLLGVVGLMSRVCQSLCQRLEKCRAPGDWPCRS